MTRPRQTSVMITGCSPGGLGHALAVEFLARGCKVIATARRPEVLVELSRAGMSTVVLDVNDEESIGDAKIQVEAMTGGKLDILVNNAGARYVMPLSDVSLPKVRSLFETNVFGVMAVTNTFLPLLVTAQGLVVNISSMSDRLAFPFKGAYAMTKAALTSYSRTLSVELAPHGVRVLNVVTAFVATRTDNRAPPEPWPEDTLFAPMRGVAQRAGGGRRMEAAAYARNVVAEALRGRGWELGPLRFLGTRESIVLGSMSTRMWILSTFLGDGWARWVMLKMWPFWMLDASRRKKGL